MPEAIEIRDPIFGFIELTSRECNIVDLLIFQRLRGIHQLAMAYLVYPGALHTRFDHSLGVCHIAGLVCKAVGINRDDTEIVRLAALLHDLGHGPFSHVSEYCLERFCQQNDIRRTKKIHELITCDIIQMYPDICKIIARNEREQIVKLLQHKLGEPDLESIISGPLDADKQDYLLRDSYFCGVKYGVFDLHQLHRTLCRRDSNDGSKYLMVDKDGVHTLEQYILAKYYLTTQVYCHRVRMICDQMLIRAITLGIEEDNIDELLSIFAYDCSDKFVNNYIRWDDARFLLIFTDKKYRGKYLHDVLTRLKERGLLKRVFDSPINVTEFDAVVRDALSGMAKGNYKNKKEEMERLVAEAITSSLKLKNPVDPNLVICHSYLIKSVKEQSQNDVTSIQVDKRPNPVPLEDESILFKSIDERLNDAFVEVYAPVQYDRPNERRRVLDKLRTPISEAIKRACAQKGGEK